MLTIWRDEFFARFAVPKALCGMSFSSSLAGFAHEINKADKERGKTTGASDKGVLSNIGAGAGTNALQVEQGSAQPAATAPKSGNQGTLRPPPVSGGAASTDGTIPGYGPDSPASGGQIVSALDLASSIMNPAALAAKAAGEDKTSRTITGRMFDDAFGGTPGTPVDTPNHVANNTRGRGDMQQGEDPRLLDRAAAAGTAALTGDQPDATGAGTAALFSDVALADRRKPKSDLAGTNMLMRSALAA